MGEDHETVKEEADTEPIEVEEEELTEDQLTEKNRKAVNDINVVVNADGELIVGENVKVKLQESQQKFENVGVVNEVEEMKNYKRCFNKRCTGKARRWRENENVLFWEALAITGQDFTLMEWYFKSKHILRNKLELKSKFHREDKLHGKLINKCLKEAARKPLKLDDFRLATTNTETAQDSNNNETATALVGV